jgi:hypothetical protein
MRASRSSRIGSGVFAATLAVTVGAGVLDSVVAGGEAAWQDPSISSRPVDRIVPRYTRERAAKAIGAPFKA